MTRERLIKVTAESELRPGMIVVAKAHRQCGRAHRMMLLRQVPSLLGGLAWSIAPVPSCLRDGDFVLRADAAIRDGSLYRVDDDLERRGIKRRAKENAS